MHMVDETPPALQRHVFGPEDLITAIQGAHFNAKQLGRATGPTTVESIQMPGAVLDLVELGMPVHFQGLMPAGSFTLIFVDRCPMPGTSLTFSKQFTDGHLGLFPPGVSADGLNPNGYANATLAIPADRFLATVEIAYPEIPPNALRDGIGLRLMPEDVQGIRRAVGSTRAYFGCGQSLSTRIARKRQADLEAAFLTGLRNACRTDARRFTSPPLRRASILGQAIDTIRAAPQEINVHDLCRHTGQSRRTIETIFRETLGTSPAHYIRVVKLHAARSTLLVCPKKSGMIKRAALEAGFWHLGHFSEAYHDLFGELPHDTLLQKGR